MTLFELWFSQDIKIELPYDPAIPLLGIYPRHDIDITLALSLTCASDLTDVPHSLDI